jgi:hypothetical protein
MDTLGKRKNNTIINSNKKTKINCIINLIKYIQYTVINKNIPFINDLFEILLYEIKNQNIDSNELLIKYIFIELHKINFNFTLIMSIIKEVINLEIVDLEKFINNYELLINAKTLLLFNSNIISEITDDSNNIIILNKINSIYKKTNNYNSVIKYIKINYEYTIYVYVKIIQYYNMNYTLQVLNKYYDKELINNVLNYSRDLINNKN